MANIARGQITVTDLNDGKTLNMFLSANQAATQIYNPDNQTYTPNYTASPYLVITPELYVSGVATNVIANLKAKPTYTINGSSTLTTYSATVATSSPYKLTIKKNMSSVDAMRIECSGIYVDPDTGAETPVKALYTVTKMSGSGSVICAIAYAPLGTIFKNDEVASLKAHCDLWRGSSIDNTNVTYKWSHLNGGTTWTDCTDTTNGFSGSTTNELTIPSSMVLNFDTFKCTITDTDSNSNTNGSSVADILSFTDLSDPYYIDIYSPTGTVLSAGATSTTLRCDVGRNGEYMPDSWYTDATCTWTMYNKTGAVDTTWGTSGVKTGRSITVTRDEVSVKATFIVTVSK